LCINDAAETTGKKKGLLAQIISANGNEAIYKHCVIHREAVATKEMTPKLYKDLKEKVFVANFMRVCTLNSQLSSTFRKAMGSEHDSHLRADV
jgi:hypothetical protein